MIKLLMIQDTKQNKKAVLKCKVNVPVHRLCDPAFKRRSTKEETSPLNVVSYFPRQNNKPKKKICIRRSWGGQVGYR